MSQMPELPVASPPSAIRLIVGVILGAAVAMAGGLILGEYPFTGVTPYIEGLLFALVVAEVILSVSRQHDRFTALAAAVCTVGGLGLAIWIQGDRGRFAPPVGGWVALAVGLVAALVRGGIRGAGPRGQNSLPS
jgi:hypothetical protein